jgi:hypothetical protein
LLKLKLNQAYRQLCAGAALYDRQQSAKSGHLSQVRFSPIATLTNDRFG